MNSVFLDLDGTIMDSEPGILSSLRHAFRENGHSDLAKSDLKWMIGPPFPNSFKKAGITDPMPVIESYRVHYMEQGMFNAAVYDGMKAAIDRIKALPVRLFIATAKPNHYARQITAHFGVAQHMDAEYGPELDGTRGQKSDLLAYALDQQNIDPATAIMVGDRTHDFHAATSNGMASIAVHWGYGSPDEYANATFQCPDTETLPEVIQRWQQEIAA